VSRWAPRIGARWLKLLIAPTLTRGGVRPGSLTILRRDQWHDGIGESSCGRQKTGREKRKLERNHNALHVTTHRNTVDTEQLKMPFPIVCAPTHMCRIERVHFWATHRMDYTHVRF
jgi:hypothetical protein